MLSSLSAAALLVLAPSPARAAPHLVKELNSAGGSTSPSFVGKAGGKGVFLALDGTGAFTLWATDGSPAGTELLTQRIAIPYNGMRFTDVGGILYFLNLVDGLVEIWRTDGTPAGTVHVVTPPNEVGSDIKVRTMADVGGKLFFESYHAGSGYTLWSSDGTEAGTALVADIQTGGGSYSEDTIADFDGIAIFQATDAFGTELWSSDGTEAGTVKVKDIKPGSGSSFPSGFAVMDGLLYFSADDGSTGYELWVSDGTEAGTTRVTDKNPGSGSFGPGYLTVLGSKLIFVGGTPGNFNEIWVSDGTDIGTVSLGGGYPLGLTRAGGYVYYRDYFGGNEIWRTDGTPAGTIELASVDPGNITEAGGDVFFSAYQSGTGYELWKTDGNPGGTALVKDIVPGPVHSSPRDLIDVGGSLLFAAASVDGQREIWTSDGTAGGTHQTVDLTPPPSADALLSQFTASGSRLAFLKNSYNVPSETWLTDGTSGGTAKINTGNTVVQSLADWYGRLVLLGYDESLNESGLWTRQTNGAIQHLYNGNAQYPAGIGTSLFFSDQDKALVSHGVPGDAVELVNIPGPVGCGLHGCVEFFSWPRSYVDIGGGVTLFLAYGVGGPALWRTDGTPAGTSQIGSIGIESYEAPINGKALGGKLYFSSSDTNGFEPWISDGTSTGTVKILEINPGAASSTPDEFTVFAGRMFFVATDPAGGRELWSTDGSGGGTSRVADINPGTWGSDPAGLSVVGASLVFAATDASGDRELWKTDGTEVGTVLLKDIWPGSESSGPGELVATGDKIYFRADDGSSGKELWSTDGSEAGTLAVADIEPGSGPSSPSGLIATGGNLFFLISTSLHGTELWVEPTFDFCGDSNVDPGETCDDGNRDPGDGCDDHCILESCGDGIVDTGEQCDDGNVDGGDGCSKACLLDCLASPEPACRTTVSAKSARLQLKVDSRPNRNQLSWNWKNGQITPKSAFGTPLTTTGYQFCVYDASGLILESNAPAGGSCSGRPCWKEQTLGYQYKATRADGFFQMGLKSGLADGAAKISAKLKGALVIVGDPTAVTAPMTVQLRNGSECWEATYSAAFSK